MSSAWLAVGLPWLRVRRHAARQGAGRDAVERAQWDRRLRKTSSAPGLLRGVRKTFDEVPDPMPGRKFSLSECM